jgi:hypothetical protein
MSKSQPEAENGSAPTTGAESEDQPTNKPDIKLYEVSVVANVQLCLTGCGRVYATDAEKATEKVQTKIDDKALDDDLEMEDSDSGATLPYGTVRYLDDADFETDEVEMVDDNVDAVDVLEAEVEELRVSISWDTDALARHKAFLEALLNEDDDEEEVAT